MSHPQLNSKNHGLKHGNTSNKIHHSSRNIAGKQVEKRCCAFFHLRTNLSRIKIICCKLQKVCCRKSEDRSTFCNKTSRFCVYYYHRSTCLAARWRREKLPGSISQWEVWIHSTAITLFCCETSLYAGGEKCSIDFQTVLQQCCETSWRILLPVLLYL